MDIVCFLDTPEMKKQMDRETTIHLTTAQCWMHKMGYHWGNVPKCQYIDGHECKDIVEYWQNVFLPRLAAIEAKSQTWTNGVEDSSASATLNIRHTVVWYHDESVFYANNQQIIRWVGGSEKAVPQAKGEGASLMVADFVSADYGWLRSPDGKENARVLLKVGKSREGYFTNDDVLKQASRAIDILQVHYPGEDHVVIFDNAATHVKQPDEALSA